MPLNIPLKREYHNRVKDRKSTINPSRIQLWKGYSKENLNKVFDRYKILDSVELNGKTHVMGSGWLYAKAW